MGAACIGLGQYGDATEAFKQVVKLDKENVLGFNNLGVAYHGQGLLSEAVEVLQFATSLKEDYAEAPTSIYCSRKRIFMVTKSGIGIFDFVGH